MEWKAVWRRGLVPFTGAKAARVLAAALLFWAGSAAAQGFAGLGTEVEGFAVPERGRALEFPADHGPHPDYRIEWWYITANLTAEDGRQMGVQWTLFRSALAPGEASGWASPQLWMGHAALTTPEAHFVDERLARGGVGQAGVTAAPFEAWIDEWRLYGPDFSSLRLEAAGEDFAYGLWLEAAGPLVLHGDQGYSVKSAAGQASYYYSQPAFEVTGTVTLPEGPVAVTGAAWLDREWSSQPLGSDQTGWDWFSLSFDSGDRLMGFLLRQADGSAYSSASWIGADGAVVPYGDGAFAATPLDWAEVAGRAVPVRWSVALPEQGVAVEVEALNPSAWMETSVPYWEGPVRVSGSHQGRGYLEMTGYEAD